MAKASAYFSQSVGNLNKPYATIAEILAQLGGVNNPVTDSYSPAPKIDVVDPTIRNITDYLTQVGAEGYQYNYDDILNVLNQATETAQVSEQEKLRQADAAYKQAVAENQQSAMDTIRSQYAQGIQNGINQGMAAANQLSTILANSKENAKTAQTNAEARVNAANDYYADLAKNGATALDKSNAAMETLMGNIRQLFNDEIQQRTSELQYNASLEESLANYLAGKYTADTNYAMNQNTQAAGIYNNNQTSLAGLINAAIGAEAQDNYSDAYQQAARLQANAQTEAARIQAAAQLDAIRQQAELQRLMSRPAATQTRVSNRKGDSGGTKHTKKSGDTKGYQPYLYPTAPSITAQTTANVDRWRKANGLSTNKDSNGRYTGSNNYLQNLINNIKRNAF